MSAKMRSDMYSDQRPSRVPIFHLSRRLAAATVFVVVVFSRLLTSAYTIIISITTSRTRCSLHTFYRNRKERATHAAPCMRSSCKSGCVLSRPERSVPADRQQPAQREGDRGALAADECARERGVQPHLCGYGRRCSAAKKSYAGGCLCRVPWRPGPRRRNDASKSDVR